MRPVDEYGSNALVTRFRGRRIRHTGVMAKVDDPRKLPDPEICIPVLKPPVREFAPVDNSDPSEVDAFNQMIRELRNLRPAAHPAVK